MNGNATERVSLTILTGFLGSGKTTLLNRLLKSPEAAESAVIVNEFGEIGLDHLLVEKSNEDGMVTLNSGCLCCTVRGDLVRTMSELFLKRSQGQVDDKLRQLVDRAAIQARSLEGLINHVLDVSRLEAGAMPLAPSEGDLRAIGEFFTPYLTGRQWQTIQNPAP